MSQDCINVEHLHQYNIYDSKQRTEKLSSINTDISISNKFNTNWEGNYKRRFSFLNFIAVLNYYPVHISQMQNLNSLAFSYCQILFTTCLITKLIVLQLRINKSPKQHLIMNSNFQYSAESMGRSQN